MACRNTLGDQLKGRQFAWTILRMGTLGDCLMVPNFGLEYRSMGLFPAAHVHTRVIDLVQRSTDVFARKSSDGKCISRVARDRAQVYDYTTSSASCRSHVNDASSE